MTTTPDTTVPAAKRGGDIHAWDRWGRAWHLVFAVALAVPTVIVVADAPSPLHGAVTAGLAAGLGLVHWWWVVRHPERCERALWMVPYWLVVLVLTALLLQRGEAYFFLVYGLYPMAFATLGSWGIAMSVVITVLVFGRGVVGRVDMGAWLSLIGSAALAAMMGGFILAIARQSEQRKQALDALAAARQELAEASHAKGALEERARLAREIHDTVAQGVVSVVTQLEALGQTLDTEHDARRHLDSALAAARGSLAELRRSVQALHPEELERATLAAALASAVNRFADESGVEADVTVAGHPRALQPDAEVALLRAAQEALANVRRHAGAGRATVTLAYAEDAVTVDVVDDGNGFDAAQADGFGLVAMRERLAEVGGDVVVASAPGRGTTITATVPA